MFQVNSDLLQEPYTGPNVYLPCITWCSEPIGISPREAGRPRPSADFSELPVCLPRVASDLMDLPSEQGRETFISVTRERQKPMGKHTQGALKGSLPSSVVRGSLGTSRKGQGDLWCRVGGA